MAVELGAIQPRSSDPTIVINRPQDRHNKTHIWNPDKYADAVETHAKQAAQETLFPGQIYADLAVFLKSEPGSRLPPRLNWKGHNHAISHAILHTFNNGPESLSSPLPLRSPKDCTKVIADGDTKASPRILFLRGHSSPEWLREVAAVCDTDPEFFNANMRYRCRQDYCSYPALPSSYDRIIRLRLMTISSPDAQRRQSDPATVDKLRTRADSKMQHYLQELAIGTDVRLSDSIVRDYLVLDEQHFVLEQEISMCMHFHDKSWLALICSDVGNNLEEGVEGPWLSDSSRLQAHMYPTIQHRNRVAFKSHVVKGTEQAPPYSKFPQTASLLPLDYGCRLDGSLMTQDPFYALSDVFRLCASSENQFLNLMNRVIAHDTDHESLKQEKPSLTNLLYCQETLGSHIFYLQDVLEVIRHRGSSNWPHVDEKDSHLRQKAEFSARALKTDYERLLRRAEALHDKCKRGMDMMSNNVLLIQSKQAIAQAKRVTKLTFIAFTYIPLSFTTSFFGMNVTQLVDEVKVSIWVWAVTSVPVLLVTLLVFFIDDKMALHWWDSAKRLLGFGKPKAGPLRTPTI